MSRPIALLLVSLLSGPAWAGGFEEEVSYQGETLKTWIAELNNPDPETRLRASRVLRQVGPEADGATAALLLATKNPQLATKNIDLTVRARIAHCLGRMGPKQVPAFAVALNLDDANLREGAVRALSWLGPQARTASAHLRRHLKSARSRDAILTALALWRIERSDLAAAALRKQLAGSDEDQVWAAWALEQLGPAAAPAATDLVAQLGHSDEFVRRYAFQALEGIGPDAVAPLVKALGSPRPRLRVEAAEALGRIGPDAEDAVPALIELAERAEPGPRAAAARALGRVGKSDEKTLAALARLLRDADRDGRLEAALALRELGASAAPAAADLCQALRETDRAVRRAAADTLIAIGKPAVKPLLGLLKDSDDLVRRQALDCLRDLAPDDALAPIQAVAKDPRDALRPRAVRALSAFGKPAVETLTALIEDPSVRTPAAAALADLGPDAAPARKALTDALKLDDADLRKEILRALTDLGAAESAPALVKLYDEDESMRLALLSAFARMPGAAKDWLPAARKALKDDRPLVRLEALAALAAAGPGAKPAAEDIAAALKDENESIRRSAGHVLALLGEDKTLLPAVKSMLAGKDEETRRAGLELAAWLGPRAKGMRAAVRERLEDDNPEVRLAAAAALIEIDPADDSMVSTLTALVQKRPRPSVFRVLSRCGAKAKEAVPALTAAVEKSTDVRLRLEAARTLGAIGPEAKPAAAALLSLLLDLERLPDQGEMEVRDRITLGKAKELTVKRGRGLDEADLALRTADAINAIRADGLDAIDRLHPVLVEMRDLTQSEVLDALSRVGAGIVPDVSKHLESDLAERRGLAARVLARLGPRAKDSMPALKVAAKDGHPWAAVESARALHAVGGDSSDSLPILRNNLAAGGVTAVRAAEGLAALGADAKPALAELLAASRSRDANLRREAVRALGACAGDLKQVKPALERRLRDRDQTVRVAAALALARVADRDPLPLLVETVRLGTDPPARLDAVAALHERGEKSKAALPVLEQTRTDPSPRLRTAAAVAVQRIDKGRDATEVLLASATASSVRPSVRAAALRGLRESPGGRRGLYAVADLARDPATPDEVRQAAREALAKWK